MGIVELIAIAVICLTFGACALVVARSAAEAAELTARRLQARERARLERAGAGRPPVSRWRGGHRRRLKRGPRRPRGD